MKCAMISAEENQLPPEIPPQLRNAGMELICRKCETSDELAEFASDADILWMFGANPALTEGVLDRLPYCRVLLRNGSGVDALPLKRAGELGIAVLNTPESIAEAVAEHAVALIFSLLRRIPMLDREVRSGVWDSGNRPELGQVRGRTLGLVGYGRIARHVERMLSGFRMNILHFDPFVPDSMELERLLQESDIVSLHCPLTESTRHLMNEERFALMKPGALLVNTSRGGVVDESALLEALGSGHLAGAALDVTDPEPPSVSNALFAMENVIFTPHIAAFSPDFEKDFWQCAADLLLRLESGADYRAMSVIPLSCRQNGPSSSRTENNVERRAAG